MTKKPAAKKNATNKPAAKPAAAKKLAAKPSAAKKPPAKKPAATKPAPRKATAKPAAKPAANKSAANKSAASKPSAKTARPAGKRPSGLWPTLSAGFAATADAAAARASLLSLLPPGAAASLYAHIAQALGAQFARATAGARRLTLKPLPSMEGFDAAQSILSTFKVYAGALAEVRAQAKEIGETWLALEQAARKKFQADFAKMALAVTQERNLADVPALMRAAIARVLSEAPVKKAKKPA
jgi:hypothetical protein